MEQSIVFIDSEISIADKKIHDLGAMWPDHNRMHSGSLQEFLSCIAGATYICGHNIIRHDLKYLQAACDNAITSIPIDTLYLSPLLFPKRPYHALLKDDKLQSDDLNNPLNDCMKAAKLFYDEINAFYALPTTVQRIFCNLLYHQPAFTGFFQYINHKPDSSDIAPLILQEYEGKICLHANVDSFVRDCPVELAYALALIGIADHHSITPPWLLRNFPKIETIIKFLRNTPCAEGCSYCDNNLNIHHGLKQFFGYNSFRTYNDEPLQEKATQAAVDGKSLLAVFPTGGGKSITFQLPALMAGEATHGLTVIISPLQSLMKDQVDNLNQIGITEAVSVNGLLDPIERANALERVSDGSATLLYISPEQLRSRTIERLLTSRTIARFVIDEAHCFSAWGQDFRVDYLYIGDFIRELQKAKNDARPIPVSCFTATAKQKVITDICDYFARKLDLNLELYATFATRENLHYTVLHKETDEEKYNTLRNLIAQKNCPTIVYVSRTKRTVEIARKLTADGFAARPFHGQMDANDKVANQEAFIRNQVQIIVATSAFGMGVDKKDVKLVIHYDISGSLEDYVQEAGRAGRDPSLQADCYVLYNDHDLDSHFMLLNRTKLSLSEIQQVWKAIKDLTKLRHTICCSPLEIARQAGWENSGADVETRVKTAVSALEHAGYIKRGKNMPHVYATSIMAKNMQEASYRIDQSSLFSEDQRLHAKRIIKSLISSRSIANAGNDDAESRVDYLADTLGLTKEEVINSVNLMRQDGLLADSMDMSAYINTSDSENKSSAILERFAKLEHFMLSQLTENANDFNLKQLNESAVAEGISSSSVKNIRTLIHYLSIKHDIQKIESPSSMTVILTPNLEPSKIIEKYWVRIEICRFILNFLYQQAKQQSFTDRDSQSVLFSLVGLLTEYKENPHMDFSCEEVTLTDVEDALLYLSKIGALKLEGGFLVLYNGMEIKRIKENRFRFKVEHYRFLDEFYQQKIQQIHIVGEYANLMVRDYHAALQFVQDYFQMDFQKFIAKYFQGDRAKEIKRNITPNKYHQLFDALSDIQSQIINDKDSKYIVVAAGPGSGKTRVLVHKLASILMMEDVKQEQLLMLTFSRAAAVEFKKRLIDLIGSPARYVDIKTFHSYCFDLLGKMGSLEQSDDVVKDAAAMIQRGEVEPEKIMKSVLVIDEAQDMDEHEFALVRALMQNNEEMRLIAVGDDDQNVYQFRGSDSKYMRSLHEEYGATLYEMTENYRSKSAIVSLANAFVTSIHNRMKSIPIEAIQAKAGTVHITHHRSHYMQTALLKQILATRGHHTCCVLTLTNNEALQMVGLLTKADARAKLIQSTDGFRLYNLLELRYFLKQIDQKLQSPVIPDALWELAKQRLFEAYKGSSCLEICRNLIHDFEVTNPDRYRSDLDEFIKESHYEDFYDDENGTIYVSTIHRAKGREFDAVYMMLDNFCATDDQQKRQLYVGMTRAKDALYIHTNTDLFAPFHVPEATYMEDPSFYEEPVELSLQLTHHDVVLDFFKDKKKLICSLRSGMPLSCSDAYLQADINGKAVRVAKLSKACCKTIQSLQDKGYSPYNAEIRFIVAWKGEHDTEETAILLPILYLKKQHSAPLFFSV